MRSLFAVLIAFALAFTGLSCRRQPPVRITDISFAMPDPHHRQILGFQPTDQPWRFTSREFALLLDAPPSDSAIYLVFDFAAPHEILNDFPSVTLSARVNGFDVGRETYTSPGKYLFVKPIPAAALKTQPARVDFEVDRVWYDPFTGKPRALIALNAALKEYEQTPEYNQYQLARAREAYRRLLETTRQLLPPDRRLELLRLFHDLPVWESLYFRNTRIIKNPLDLFMIQQLIWELQPEFIVETGTWHGGSALYWAFVLEGMGLRRSRVITVDVSNYTQQVSTEPLWKQYVTFYHGSSVDPEIVASIAQEVRGARVLVMLDSNHSMAHVRKELRAYAPMVNPGSYLIVEDTHLDAVPTKPHEGAGPFGAVQEFLASPEGKDFEVDSSREALILTFNPGGWLRRKK